MSFLSFHGSLNTAVRAGFIADLSFSLRLFVPAAAPPSSPRPSLMLVYNFFTHTHSLSGLSSPDVPSNVPWKHRQQNNVIFLSLASLPSGLFSFTSGIHLKISFQLFQTLASTFSSFLISQTQDMNHSKKNLSSGN